MKWFGCGLLLILSIASIDSWLCKCHFAQLSPFRLRIERLNDLRPGVEDKIFEIRKSYKELSESEERDDLEGTLQKRSDFMEAIIKSADALNKIHVDVQTFENIIKDERKDNTLRETAYNMKVEFLQIKENLEDNLNDIFSEE